MLLFLTLIYQIIVFFLCALIFSGNDADEVSPIKKAKKSKRRISDSSDEEIESGNKETNGKDDQHVGVKDAASATLTASVTNTPPKRVTGTFKVSP